MNKNKTIIDSLLEDEGYTPQPPYQFSKHFHHEISRLIKEEIRKHKWIENEKGRNLEWKSAVIEWMDLHYDKFLEAITPSKRKRTRKVTRVNEPSTVSKPFHVRM